MSSGLVIQTVSIITLKAGKFLCYLFHKFNTFLTLHLYMCVNEKLVYLMLNKLHVAMFLKFMKFFYALWYYVMRPFSQLLVHIYFISFYHPFNYIIYNIFTIKEFFFKSWHLEYLVI